MSESPSGQTTPQSQSQFGGETKSPQLHAGRVVVHPSEFSAAALQGRSLLAHVVPGAHPVRACSGLPRHARAVSAEYLHAPAALVYRRPEGSTQVVDLYVCGSDRPVRSTTLPAP